MSKDTHKEMVSRLSELCRELNVLMEYFDPPNIMGWYDKDESIKWDVYIRRKGSEEQFSKQDWSDRYE